MQRHAPPPRLPRRIQGAELAGWDQASVIPTAGRFLCVEGTCQGLEADLADTELRARLSSEL